MAVDTFIAYVGVYDNVSDADADYALVKDLHTKENLIDSYDAAVIERRADGKSRSPRSMRRRPGSAACSAGAWAWPPGWSWSCSRSPPSAAG